VVVFDVLATDPGDNLIHPKVIGKALNINPVVISSRCFIGERVAGSAFGVFLAIPIAWNDRQLSSEQRPSPTGPTTTLKKQSDH